MTLKEYLTNPLGKGDASLPGGKLIIQNLERKYIELDKKKGNQIKLTSYYDGKTGDVYMHLVVPTETERGNTYDVVIRFFDGSNKNKLATSIADYDIQLFANTPSFVYTHAYVYHEYGLSVDFLEQKLGKISISQAPVVRNKFEIVSYDKYLFFAAKFIQDGRMMSKLAIQAKARPFSQKALLTKVRSIKKIMEEYHAAEAKLRRDIKYVKDQEKRLAGKPKRLSLDSGSPIGLGKKVPKITGTKSRVKTVKPVKTSGNRIKKK